MKGLQQKSPGTAAATPDKWPLDTVREETHCFLNVEKRLAGAQMEFSCCPNTFLRLHPLDVSLSDSEVVMDREVWRVTLGSERVRCTGSD